ncbi:Aminomethyltransferase [bacterium HR17]|jgi:aminomethyltransferase|uniref:Aminomethyltransferase n=1 Tax=Candidatus Fervidibacter japonicus TaxID=2035412 RepID=A0A2H5XDA5_9BACT|nr:Aminomethyltransferase [bacterium HR17]
MAETWRTPLFNAHQRAGAKFVEFAGWEMPIHYGSILGEAKVVRASCGMFDVSHMGRVFVQTLNERDEDRGTGDEQKGDDVAEALDRLVTMDIKGMADEQVRYGFLCNERGGIIDDLTVARLDDCQFLAVVNAARRETDFAWMRQNLPNEVALIDRTFETAMIAVQGPDAIAIVDELADVSKKPSSLKRFRIDSFLLVGVECLVSRTGYTGEDGVEIICLSDEAERIWDALLAKGVQPCGLGARDILRLEAGMCLYGHDLNEDTTPLEADLMRFVAMDKSFIGKDAIERQMREGIKRKRVGLKLFTRATAREGAQVLADGQPIGVITSGVFSPHLNTAIAMAYVAIEWANIGTKVQVLVREQPHDAEIVPMPFLPLPSRKA